METQQEFKVSKNIWRSYNIHLAILLRHLKRWNMQRWKYEFIIFSYDELGIKTKIWLRKKLEILSFYKKYVIYYIVILNLVLCVSWGQVLKFKTAKSIINKRLNLKRLKTYIL